VSNVARIGMASFFDVMFILSLTSGTRHTFSGTRLCASNGFYFLFSSKSIIYHFDIDPGPSIPLPLSYLGIDCAHPLHRAHPTQFLVVARVVFRVFFATTTCVASASHLFYVISSIHLSCRDYTWENAEILASRPYSTSLVVHNT
jgi:hypothetical protein